MNKLMDKLFNNVKFDKKYVLFSLIIIIIGIITGSLFIVILNSNDKKLIIEYIQDFINNINTNDISNLKNIFINNYITILLFIILGITYFFSIFNIFILFYKSFIIGFSISSFILVYKLKGLILSILYIFPHLIINTLIFALLTAFTLKLSYNMIKYIIKKKDVNIRAYFNKYIYIILFTIIIISITSIYEGLIIPKILSFCCNFFKI